VQPGRPSPEFKRRSDLLYVPTRCVWRQHDLETWR
jgi:hypothetical protein